MVDVVIREYRSQDRDSVREIAWETALKGDPADAFFQDQDLLKDFLTGYFTDYESQSSFVAESEGKVVGYVIGSVDVRLAQAVFRKRLLPRLIVKACRRLSFAKGKNFSFLMRLLLSFLKGEFHQPDFSEEYPATLHINVRSGFRGAGVGSQLILAYLDYLEGLGVSGIHLATPSQEAGRFYLRHGFKLLHQRTRSYMRHVLQKDITVSLYGKKLNV